MREYVVDRIAELLIARRWRLCELPCGSLDIEGETFLREELEQTARRRHERGVGRCPDLSQDRFKFPRRRERLLREGVLRRTALAPRAQRSTRIPLDLHGRRVGTPFQRFDAAWREDETALAHDELALPKEDRHLSAHHEEGA